MIGALEMAFMEQIVERNVARDVRPLRQVARDRYLSDAEFNAIKAKATPTLHARHNGIVLPNNWSGCASRQQRGVKLPAFT